MILQTRSDEEYNNALRLLGVINELRQDSHLHRPLMLDTPWIKVVRAKECYL
jgi:hypothetical protein